MTGGVAGPAAAPPARRRRWLVWLLAVAVLVEIPASAVGLAYVGGAGRPATMIADLPAPPTVDARPAPADLGAAADRTAEVRALLDTRAAALLRRDRAGWLS